MSVLSNGERDSSNTSNLGSIPRDGHQNKLNFHYKTK
jgi:hypothetical protein